MNEGRADRSETGEWWVPLTEKAYAKFCGSYDQIRGGCPCWALTDLTGGIAIQQKQESLFIFTRLIIPKFILSFLVDPSLVGNQRFWSNEGAHPNYTS